ncbi:MAG: MarR family winged helix-turn-helix transcriptional regulator [Acidiferrobacteraceae bacterium]
MGNAAPSSETRLDLAQRCAASLLEILPRVMDRVRSEISCGAAGALSLPQFRCLCFIDRNPETSLGALANQIGVSTATTSVIVDRLVRQGLVARAAAPRERRRLSLSLTGRGAEGVALARAVAREHIAGLMATCSEQDLQTLCRGLDVLQELFARTLEPTAKAGPE